VPQQFKISLIAIYTWLLAPWSTAPSNRNSALESKIKTLHLKNDPIVCVISSKPHPAHPNTMLEFCLLTEAQLDSMAHYYSQSVPSGYTNIYSRTMSWDRGFLSVSREDQAANDGRHRLSATDRILLKQRKFAKFIWFPIVGVNPTHQYVLCGEC
jgi:hypothetical protein